VPLVELELHGLIRQYPGKMFARALRWVLSTGMASLPLRKIEAELPVRKE
jgi:hypothetical protein